MTTSLIKIPYSIYFIPTIELTHDKSLNGNRSIDLIWLKWSLNINLTKDIESACEHDWKPAFSSGYRQCKKCHKLSKS
jgi:hypothetical protein